jgi:hypothetical protein
LGQILKPEKVLKILDNRSVQLFYGLADTTAPEKSGMWNIRNGFLNEMACKLPE